MIFTRYYGDMYPRHITTRVRDALADTPVTVVNGARQVGKSTLVQSIASERDWPYYTLDDATTLAAIDHDPEGFLAGIDGTVVLDEVQRVPELFLAIKAAIDRDRRPGRYLLTGSANVLLIPEIADSLAGRMEVLPLWPLSAAELEGEADFNRADWLFDGPFGGLRIPPCDRDDLIARLRAGGFPEAVARKRPQRRSAWFRNYLNAILQRDVRDLARLEQLTEVPNLLSLIAHRSGNLLNFAELSRSVGLPQTTLKRYFSLLETLFLVVRLPAWERNSAKRLVKSPKVFIPDTGLLASLMAPDTAPIEPASRHGGWMETFVLAELCKHLAFSERGLRLWHYRTQTGMEVDFLLEDPKGMLTGIEVKASGTVEAKDFKGLRHLKETEPKRFKRGIVLYCGREPVPFARDLIALPLSIWWASAPF